MEKFSKNMKLVDLVDVNYRLLGVLSRVGIDGAFGEKTVLEACEQNGLDADTVILLCQIYSLAGIRPTRDVLRRSHIGDVLRYLHQSHDYYLNYALESVEQAIDRLVEPCAESRKQVVHNFYQSFKAEMKDHFEFEENEMIPYIQRLIIGQRNDGFCIERFEENHSEMSEKLSDLKNLVMKSLPPECSTKLRADLLMLIYELKEDLRCHIEVEDNILVPMVRLLENPSAFRKVGSPAEETPEERDELSAREKEILVAVAQGKINKEIADEKNISINTVISHRKNITRKTGIKTVSGLTVYAILNNLIDINTIE